uniref:PABS domain-containing protein n=1 Tax=Timema monikensis TaxID=170555 RepID=A0A7R9EIE9_9NEOP|nr:unnamed protein product [Timema monikensis]
MSFREVIGVRLCRRSGSTVRYSRGHCHVPGLVWFDPRKSQAQYHGTNCNPFVAGLMEVSSKWTDVYQTGREFKRSRNIWGRALTHHTQSDWEPVPSGNTSQATSTSSLLGNLGPAVSLFQPSYFKLMRDALKPGGVVCSQAGTVWANLEHVAQTLEHCRSVFNVAAFAHAAVPTYPSGQIGFVLGSLNSKLVNGQQKYTQGRNSNRVALQQLWIGIFEVTYGLQRIPGQWRETNFKEPTWKCKDEDLKRKEEHISHFTFLPLDKERSIASLSNASNVNCGAQFGNL